MNTEKYRVLVVDDEKNFATVLKIFLEKQGYEVVTAPSVTEGQRALAAKPFHLVLTDLRVGEESGLDLLRAVKEKTPETAVIVMTGYASLESARTALQQQAYDYLLKPFNDMENDLLRVVRRALEHQELQRKHTLLLARLQEYYLANEKALARAKKVQQSLVPQTLPVIRGWALQGKLVSVSGVGGGFYNVRQLPGGALVGYAGDVGGNGLDAALLLATVSSIVEGLVHAYTDPAEIVHLLSTIMSRHLQEGFRNFVSLCLVTLDPMRGALQWTGAGSPPPLLVRGGRGDALEGSGPFLGQLRRTAYLTRELTLDTGDRLALFSQGLIEAVNARGEAFGRERILQSLKGSWDGLAERSLAAWSEFVAPGKSPASAALLVFERRA